MKRFKVSRLNFLMPGCIVALASAAWGDCLGSLQGSWEIDMERAAVGQSQKRRDAVVQFRGPDPFMVLSFTADEMRLKEFTGYEWRESEPWNYEVTSEQGPICEIVNISKVLGPD